VPENGRMKVGTGARGLQWEQCDMMGVTVDHGDGSDGMGVGEWNG